MHNGNLLVKTKELAKKEAIENSNLQSEVPSKKDFPVSLEQKIEPLENAVNTLRNGIVERFHNPDYITLAMHVNLNTAKADLIPFPDANNIKKMKENLDHLPKKVQEVITKSIPKEEMKATQEIYGILDNILNANKAENNKLIQK